MRGTDLSTLTLDSRDGHRSFEPGAIKIKVLAGVSYYILVDHQSHLVLVDGVNSPIQSPGHYQLSASIEPAGVEPITPAISWPTPAAIVYGTALGGEQLNATSPVAGSFDYRPPAGTILSVSTNHQLVTIFTPVDLAAYRAATQFVYIAVLKAMPSVSWASPTQITYGTPLTELQLNATTDQPGSFSYNPPPGTILPAGVHQLTSTFLPDNPNYQSRTSQVSLTVLKAAQEISFSFPTQIYAGAKIPLTASSSSGLEPVLRVDSGPAILANGTIVATNQGQITIRATQDGDINHLPAAEVVRVTEALPIAIQIFMAGNVLEISFPDLSNLMLETTTAPALFAEWREVPKIAFTNGLFRLSTQDGAGAYFRVRTK